MKRRFKGTKGKKPFDITQWKNEMFEESYPVTTGFGTISEEEMKLPFKKHKSRR